MPIRMSRRMTRAADSGEFAARHAGCARESLYTEDKFEFMIEIDH
jgi:hypothetical protein